MDDGILLLQTTYFMITYYKNQIFFVLVSFCFFAYAIFHYIRYKDVESRSTLEVVTIMNISCSAAPRLASGIKISKNNREYSVELPYDTCYKYSVGENISLLHDEKYNKFYLPDYFSVYKFRTILTTIILVLVIFPWKGVVSSASKGVS